MNPIFISYKREDRATAEKLADILKCDGYEVWYDFELLSGDPFRNVIRQVIDRCSVAIVIWSNRAVLSDFVLDEATHAKSKGKLLPVRIDSVDLPLGFGQLHTDDLSAWDGSPDDINLKKFLRSVQKKAGPPVIIDGAARGNELSEFQSAVFNRDNRGLRDFLKKYPDSTFRSIAEREAETRSSMLYWWRQLPFATRAAASVAALVAFAALIFVAIGMSVNQQFEKITDGPPEVLPIQKLEALVKTAVELAAKGQCSSEIMAPRLLAACQAHSESMRIAMASLGKVQSITSEGRHRSESGFGRTTRFLVQFENGRMKWEANGDADGRLAAFWSAGQIQ